MSAELTREQKMLELFDSIHNAPSDLSASIDLHDRDGSIIALLKLWGSAHDIDIEHETLSRDDYEWDVYRVRASGPIGQARIVIHGTNRRIEVAA